MAKAQAKVKTKSAGTKKASTGRKKVKKSVSVGKAIINATFNNTLVYLTDVNGNVLAWNTAGGQGFKGSRKSTPYAAQKAAEAACIAAKEAYGLRKVDIYINGPGAGGEAAARAVGVCFKGSVGFVKNITGIPFNGCRAEKERRV